MVTQKKTRYNKSFFSFGNRSSTLKNESQILNRSGQNQNWQITKSLHLTIVIEENKIHLLKRFFWAKHYDTETPKTNERKLGVDCDFPDSSTYNYFQLSSHQLPVKNFGENPGKKKNMHRKRFQKFNRGVRQKENIPQYELKERTCRYCTVPNFNKPFSCRARE